MLAAPVFWRTIRTSTLESPVMDSRNRLESSLYNIKGTILLRRCYAACNHFSFAIKYPNTYCTGITIMILCILLGLFRRLLEMSSIGCS
jgi:hypothetical protein